MTASRILLPRLRRSRRAVTFLSLFAFAIVGWNASGAEIHFNRDIRPILSEHCLACHGPDPGARKADLRLDTQAGLFEATADRGPTVVPRKPEESELWYRISTEDEDDLMPPPDSNKALTPEQKERIRQWIADGGEWEDHWSFIKPERPPVPLVDSSTYQA